ASIEDVNSKTACPNVFNKITAKEEEAPTNTHETYRNCRSEIMVVSKYNTPSRWRNVLYTRLDFFFDCFFSMAQKYPQTTNKTIIFSILVQYVFFRFRNEPSNP